jgi:hypothetical protein
VSNTTMCATTSFSLHIPGVNSANAAPNPTGIRAVGDGDAEAR